MVESPNGSALQASESLPYLSPSGGGGRGLVSSRAHTDLYHSTLSLLLREPLFGVAWKSLSFSPSVGTQVPWWAQSWPVCPGPPGGLRPRLCWAASLHSLLLLKSLSSRSLHGFWRKRLRGLPWL